MDIVLAGHGEAVVNERVGRRRRVDCCGHAQGLPSLQPRCWGAVVEFDEMCRGGVKVGGDVGERIAGAGDIEAGRLGDLGEGRNNLASTPAASNGGRDNQNLADPNQAGVGHGVEPQQRGKVGLVAKGDGGEGLAGRDPVCAGALRQRALCRYKEETNQGQRDKDGFQPEQHQPEQHQPEQRSDGLVHSASLYESVPSIQEGRPNDNHPEGACRGTTG